MPKWRSIEAIASRLTSEDTLLEAESHGLIATDGAEVRLAHPLYGEAVRARLPPLRARSLRMRLVDSSGGSLVGVPIA